MHTIVTTIQEINGKKVEVPMIFGTGNLTNNPPEVRVVGQNGNKVLSSMKGHRFAIAFNNGKDKDATFYAVEAWNKNAELMHSLCFKGQPVEIAARIKVEKYTTQEGEERTQEIAVIERFDVKEYKKRDGQQSQSQQSQPQQSETKEPVTVGAPVPESNVVDIADDDLPF